MPKFKVLFITRKYPPSIGGMQNINFQLYTNLAKISQTELISWGKSQRWLPFFYPVFFLRGLITAVKFKPDIIHLGDGLMSLIGLLIKKITGAKVSCTVHGLDVTFPFLGYQKVVPFCLSRLDKIICVSTATQRECIKRGIPETKTSVIPNGISANEYFIDRPKAELRKELKVVLGLDLRGKKVLLTVGRLVKRKGHEWFIRKIVPSLPKDVLYIIAGDGQEKGRIQEAIKEKGLSNRVFMLGGVTEEVKRLLYNCADLFVMPNVRAKGDMEGFGIVILEASSAGLPVIAADLEGIKDAIESDKNGYLYEPDDHEKCRDVVLQVLNGPQKLRDLSCSAREFASSFNWNKISQSYLDLFVTVVNRKVHEGENG